MSTAVMTSPTTSRGLTAKGRATRLRIVSVASQLMLEQGVEHTTIEDIQAAAKVSASQLYHYFSDKGALTLAVIDHQTDAVLDIHHEVLDRLDSFEALQEWRDQIVGIVKANDCVGGCPLGSLASGLNEIDPAARAALTGSFGRWESLLRTGLRHMRDNGELRADADTDVLALSLLSALQGGLLLSQTRRETAPLEAALDMAIAYLRTLSR
jgi:AcrR family transcriptional regulator